jgi:opacity protein-like surface antigen
VRLFLKQLRNRLRTFGQTIKQTTMKKLMIFVGALTLTGSLFAQKPASDDARYSLEGLANLNTSNGMNFTAPSLRLRYFVNDNIAARVQFGFGGDGSSVANTPSTESYTFYENADGTGATGTVDIARSQWNLGVGAEYHLKGTDRMSPYFTAGISFGSGSYEETWKNSDGDAYSAVITDASITGGYSSFGWNVGAGFDYYVADNLYLGLELNLTSTNYNYDPTNVTVMGNLADFQPESSMSFTNIGAAHGSVRIGWRF